MKYGLLDFARRLHAKCPNEKSSFYHWQYLTWLGLFHPLEHDKYRIFHLPYSSFNSG